MACRFLCLFIVVGGAACTPAPPNIGAVECVADEECEASCAASAESFGATRSSSRQLQAASCEPEEFIIDDGTGSGDRSFAVDEVCNCSVDGSDGTVALHGEERLGCLSFGHAGHCLYSPSAFAGCETGNAASCDGACALLEERLLQDAQTAYVVDVVSAECTDGGSCACTWRVDDSCFSDSRVHGPCDAP